MKKIQSATRFKKAFTLLELLVIVAIMGMMVTVGIVNVRSGQGAARVKGATRDVFAAIRRARSTALVTQQSVVVEYSTTMEDEDPVVNIKVTSAKLISEGVDFSKVRTVTGQYIVEQRELVHIEKAETSEEKPIESKSSGETLEDVLFTPIATDIVKGMRIKVVKDSELLAEGAVRQRRVSAFSNVDYLLGVYAKRDEKSSSLKTQEDSQSNNSSDDAKAPLEDISKPVSVVWEPNGRVEPHQVWIYADGQSPEEGLSIKIDRFGAAKVISSNDN
jgi:Tfp pilus assembly protein FimT